MKGLSNPWKWRVVLAAVVVFAVTLWTVNTYVSRQADVNHGIAHFCNTIHDHLKQYKVRGRFDRGAAKRQANIFHDFVPVAPSHQAKHDLKHGRLFYAKFHKKIVVLPLPNCDAFE